MQYKEYYDSPLGQILLVADDEGLVGLWFAKHKYKGHTMDPEAEIKETDAIAAAKKWLDQYFVGKEPEVAVPIHFIGSDFRKSVWEILKTIPYGQTVTYGEIAKLVGDARGVKKMASQAVGGAVGHNPVSIIVPCHRVVGANGSLIGYGGGIDKKVKLLELEGVDMAAFTVPTKGTAL